MQVTHKFFIAFAFVISSCYKQKQDPDTQKKQHDSLSIIKLLTKAEDSAGYDNKVANQLIHQAIKRIDTVKNKHWLYAKTLDANALIYYYKDNYTKAIKLLEQANEVYRSSGFNKDRVNDLRKLGLIYQHTNQYDKALEALFLALKLSEKEKNEKSLSTIYNNLGIAYDDLHDYEKALEYYSKSLKIANKNKDNKRISWLNNNIGALYISKEDFKNALAYFNKAKAITNPNEDPVFYGRLIFNLGEANLGLKNYEGALPYYYQAASLQKSNNQPGYCIDLLYLGITYNKLNQQDSVKKYIELCKPCDTITDDFKFKNDIESLKYEYYKTKGYFPQALLALEKSKIASDSLIDRNTNLDIQRKYFTYQYEKKAEADSLKHQLLLNKTEKKVLKNRNSLIVTLLVLSLAIAIAIIWRNRNKLLKNEKKLVEQQALRARMNPHFIFNSLNTIDSFVLQGRQDEASKMIQDFSKLSRQVLDFSDIEFITLKDEIAFLVVYLDIEKIRANHSFSYNINNLANNLDFKLPPMILQPFVENAILHGVKPRKDTLGNIDISFFSDINELHIKIEDNGIGRKASEALQLTKNRTSKAILIVNERLQRLYPTKNTANFITFTDKEQNSGTIVNIYIPYYNA